MILDKIENLRLYAGINPYINKVADFIGSHDLSSMPEGRVYIDGENCFANFDIAHGKRRDESLIETHDRMVDIQIVLDAEEEIAWSPRAELPVTTYDHSRDIAFYPSAVKRSFVGLHPGEFILFLPTDGHAPCITEKESYKKVIFKLKA